MFFIDRFGIAAGLAFWGGTNLTSEWRNNEIVIVIDVILQEDVFCPP